MARQRITEDFVKHLSILKERSGNSPQGIKRALECDHQVASSIRELETIISLIEWHRNNSKHRFIVQAHPKFSEVLKDYRERWQVSARITLQDWEDERDGREKMSASRIVRELNEISEKLESSGVVDEDEEWDFDPEEHSAAAHIEGMADYIGERADDELFFSRAKGAWDWLVNTVGVDLSTVEKRWREFPIIIIPEHVSNAHGLTEPRSLYRYLTDIRLAYMIGADLAAISMSRAATEILIRYHYNNDPKTPLTRLVKETQKRREFAFLRPLNLVGKIEDGNNILHFNEDIRNPDRNRAIVRDWVKALQIMIANAPRPQEHVDHG